MMDSMERLIIVEEAFMLDEVIAENHEAVNSAVLILNDGTANRFSEFMALWANQINQKGDIQMNTLKTEANAKFEAFLNTVNPDILSEDAKAVLMTAPTQWARYIEIAVTNFSMRQLTDLAERNQFSSIFKDLHEKIAVSTSMVQFVEWLHEVGLSFDAHQDSLKLVNSTQSRDAYETLELFVEKFYQ